MVMPEAVELAIAVRLAKAQELATEWVHGSLCEAGGDGASQRIWAGILLRSSEPFQGQGAELKDQAPEAGARLSDVTRRRHHDTRIQELGFSALRPEWSFNEMIDSHISQNPLIWCGLSVSPKAGRTTRFLSLKGGSST